MQTKNSQTFARCIIGAVIALLLMTCMAVPRLEASPQADAHFKHGLQLSLQKKWPQAEAEYRQAIALDPKNATYKSYLADALAAQGKFAQAQDSYKQSDTAKKNYPQPGYQKSGLSRPGRTRPPVYKPGPQRTGSLRTGSLRTGTGTTSRLPARNPGSGSTSTSTSRTSPGTTFVIPPSGNGGSGAGSNHTTVTFTLPDGHTVIVTGRPGDSIMIPSDSRANTGDGDAGDNAGIENDPHYIKAQDYRDDGKWPQSEAEYRAALKTHPTSTDLWVGLGDVCCQQDKWQDAEKAHRKAVQLDPNESYFHAQLAFDLLKQNRRDEAMQEAKEAKRLGLQDHEVFDELGLTGATREQ